MINITKVVTKNIFIDIIASFQNLVGINLTSYEKMVDKGIEQVKEELKKKKIKLSWYRISNLPTY